MPPLSSKMTRNFESANSRAMEIPAAPPPIMQTSDSTLVPEGMDRASKNIAKSFLKSDRSHLRVYNSPTTAETTASQSPGFGCRNKRAVGYQGQSPRSSSQRQSAACSSNTQTGRPNAPAKCTTDVSDEITRSSTDIKPAVS